MKTQTNDWIGFDLDGTLADQADGEWDGGVGKPIWGTIDIARKYLNIGIPVKIVTARVASSHPIEEIWRQRRIVEDWTEEIFGKRLEVTAEKDPGMVVLYDDRAIQVVKNAGEIVMGGGDE